MARYRPMGLANLTQKAGQPVCRILASGYRSRRLAGLETWRRGHLAACPGTTLPFNRIASDQLKRTYSKSTG